MVRIEEMVRRQKSGRGAVEFLRFDFHAPRLVISFCINLVLTVRAGRTVAFDPLHHSRRTTTLEVLEATHQTEYELSLKNVDRCAVSKLGPHV
jgi:hypothetical protein